MNHRSLELDMQGLGVVPGEVTTQRVYGNTKNLEALLLATLGANEFGPAMADRTTIRWLLLFEGSLTGSIFSGATLIVQSRT